MARPGGGRSGGGGSRSSSSRSSSRRSSSRPSSSRSSRPMGGGSSFGGGGGFGGGPRGGYGGGHRGYNPPPPPPPRGPRYHRPRTRVVYTSGRRSSGCSSILAAIIVLAIVLAAFSIASSRYGGSGISFGSGSIPSSTIDRERIESGYGYDSDCIVDELGWFDNEAKTEGRLKEFYEETGVQPYIILLDNSSEYGSNYEEREAVAITDIYETYADNEYALMYVYFVNEANPDDLGDEVLVCGDAIETVMDTEAISVFWAYLEKNWYSDMSSDDMFVKTFTSTADRIMDKSTTGKDVAKYALIAVAVIAGGYIIIKLVKLKHKRAKEEAEETERILNTPMESLVEAELKDTMKKYDEKPQQ